MKSLSDIRAGFLEFFRERGHAIVPSSPLVPRNDPTLLFTNAGMVQFKNVFTGAEKRPYSRATSVQKCVRAGGKHNDLDNVGYTARHHTFFEMLGNFSFGDYFKEEAILFAWDFATKTAALPRDKLLVTVYPSDEQARALWRKIAGISDARIIGHESNLWAMGPVGPCGFCSEIFYDQGDAVAGGPPGSADEDGDRYLEFWNLVFMQFEQVDADTRIDLPKPSIDTGLGLERLTAILQGVQNNYDTDLFRHLIAASVEFSGAKSEGEAKFSHRVIADHLRSTSFLIADGVLPSNDGRGYVLRRIMRRGMRHAHLIGSKDPLMYRLVPALVAEMGTAYPELKRAEALIAETLKLEETRFRETLARGIKLLDEATGNMKAGDSLAGDVAFKLYDTFGFPLDLTQDALKPRGIAVDTDGFNAAMAKQRADARKAWAGSGESATETVWFSLRERLGATEFLGYETETAEGVASAIVRDGAEVGSLALGERGWLVLNQTPFYGESGGQVGDVGKMLAPGLRLAVLDAKKRLGDLIVHEVEVEEGTLQVGAALALRVDHEARSATRANHSATHLLHEALRQVLGDHVAQKGSLVSPDRLRFDIAHPKPITDAELAAVEDIANRVVLENAPVVTRLMGLDEARASGARALFDEKYGDEVRVVSMGTIDGGDNGPRPYSVELCGGTHVARTGDIGLVSIVGESAVAAGVRRIEAKTRDAARHRLNEDSRALADLAGQLRAPVGEVGGRLEALIDERKKLERELADARRKLAMGGGAGGGGAPREVAGVKFYARQVSGVEMKDLKSLADEAKQSLGSGVAAIVATAEDGKASLVVGVTGDLTQRFNAVDLVRRGAAALGGKGGGGRPDMAQAGGPEGAKAADALAAVEAAMRDAAA